MPTSRTANGRWKRFRQSVIRNAGTNPACHWCGGMLNPRAARGEMGAIEVDHIVPYVQRPDLEFCCATPWLTTSVGFVVTVVEDA